MQIPDSPRTIFRNSPLIEVVCQIRFPSILKIALPPIEFQERIRSRYPGYKEKKDFSSFFPNAPDQVPIFNSPVVHEFGSADGTEVISLSQGFLALTCRRYQRWEDFSEKWQIAQDALVKSYQPTYIERVGLRYQDVISRKRLGIETVAWKELLKPEIAGLLGVWEEGSIKELIAQNLLDIDGSNAQVRVVHGLFTLEDSEVAYLIDTDFFHEGTLKIDDIKAELHGFNQSAGNLFRWCISPKLYAALAPEPMA